MLGTQHLIRLTPEVNQAVSRDVKAAGKDGRRPAAYGWRLTVYGVRFTGNGSRLALMAGETTARQVGRDAGVSCVS